MRVTTVAIFAVVAVAVQTPDPNWSFSSTLTITDNITPWYTVIVPFLATVTTQVSGIVETITTTKVSISIGTEPPRTIISSTSVGISPCVDGNSAIMPRIEVTRDLDGIMDGLPSICSMVDNSDVVAAESPAGNDGNSVISHDAVIVTAITTTTSNKGNQNTPTPAFVDGSENDTSPIVSGNEIMTTKVAFTMGRARPVTRNLQPLVGAFSFPAETASPVVLGSSSTINITGTVKSGVVPIRGTFQVATVATGPSTSPDVYPKTSGIRCNFTSSTRVHGRSSTPSPNPTPTEPIITHFSLTSSLDNLLTETGSEICHTTTLNTFSTVNPALPSEAKDELTTRYLSTESGLSAESVSTVLLTITIPPPQVPTTLMTTARPLTMKIAVRATDALVEINPGDADEQPQGSS
ncbi:hypothetical protein SAMD00023353_1001990 [Rosellinia necatrix]|uniref:Uncharacterized protein n=1 Tax=Rosellinia necatrix TaxID=77044 RepID=A0A1W2TBM7_ROSNE|nr:hypothetical protein SAMD00023353_1001990 [Rosellinia necatrix]